jgi:hypothetical protein
VNATEIREWASELAERRATLRYDEERFAAICDENIRMNHDSNVPDSGANVPTLGTAARAHLAEEKQTFEGGATRSVKLERYDLIPIEGDECNARRFGLGSVKHGDGNWKGGGVEFIKGIFNHQRAHTVSLIRNGIHHDDDDIGAMCWAAYALAWFRVHKPAEMEEALKQLR